MPKEESRSNHFANPMAPIQKQFAETGKKIGEATLQVQTEFFKVLEEMGQEVMAIAATEAELGRKLSEKLTAAQSVPAALVAFQEWMSEEISARAEVAGRFMTNGQKLMSTSTQLLSNGWSSGGSSA
jgi:hypothetical protein